VDAISGFDNAVMRELVCVLVRSPPQFAGWGPKMSALKPLSGEADVPNVFNHMVGQQMCRTWRHQKCKYSRNMGRLRGIIQFDFYLISLGIIILRQSNLHR
jgi:hypothetical protein